jgi:hypothetical protein
MNGAMRGHFVPASVIRGLSSGTAPDGGESLPETLPCFRILAAPGIYTGNLPAFAFLRELAILLTAILMKKRFSEELQAVAGSPTTRVMTKESRSRSR